MINFIENNKVCRNIQILNYFDENTTSHCGICDVCISKNKNIKHGLELQIISLLKKHTEISIDEIMTIINADESSIILHLRSLLSKEKIGMNHQNKYFLL